MGFLWFTIDKAEMDRFSKQKKSALGWIKRDSDYLYSDLCCFNLEKDEANEVAKIAGVTEVFVIEVQNG